MPVNPLLVISGILGSLVTIYTWLLWARIILEFVRIFKRDFRPRGVLLVLSEVVYTLTDPPIRFFRRVLPPIRFGQIMLDLGWMLTMLTCWIILALLP